MKRRKINFYILIFTLLSYTSCKKDTGFGSNLLPEDNPLELEFVEDDAISSRTVFENPLRTDRLLFNYLGFLEDPLYGSTKGSVSIQFGLPSEIDVSLAPYTLEDVSLKLYYDNTFGDTTAPVSIGVYQLLTKFNGNITYKSNYVPPYNSIPIGMIENYYYSDGFAKDSNGVINGLLEIPLEKSFGESVVDLIETGLIRNDTLLYAQFPGIFIQPLPSQTGKAMLQLDLTNLLGGVYLKLKDSQGEQHTFILPFSNTRFMHNSIEHQYSSSEIQRVVDNGGVGADGEMYIQSQAGVKTEVSFDNLDVYKGKLINKAVLEIYEVKKNPGSLRVLSVYPLMKGKNGENVALKDYTSNYYGPTYVDSTVNDQNGGKLYSYKVNITNLMKEYALGKTDFKSIYLTCYPVFSEDPIIVLDNSSTVLSQHIEPANLIFGSENYSDTERRMRFKVWYSQNK